MNKGAYVVIGGGVPGSAIANLIGDGVVTIEPQNRAPTQAYPWHRAYPT
jgi:hypothetical protein